MPTVHLVCGYLGAGKTTFSKSLAERESAVLFSLGRFLIGLYIGKSSVASGFGAAGSLVVVFVWVYYSAQIFLLGAEFTWVYATTQGSMKGLAEAPAASPGPASGAPAVPSRSSDAAVTGALVPADRAPPALADRFAVAASDAARRAGKAPAWSGLLAGACAAVVLGITARRLWWRAIYSRVPLR